MKTFAALLAACGAAAAVADSAHGSTHGFDLVGSADPSAPVSFGVALPERNLRALDKAFWAISTPGSKDYGKFLTTKQVNDLTATAPKHVRASLDFFGKHRVMCMPQADRNSLRCNGSAAAVSAIFGAELQEWKHTKSGAVVRRFHPLDHGKMTFPEELQGHAKFVTGLVGFPTPHYGRMHPVKGIRTTADSYTTDVVIPETIYDLYKSTGVESDASVTQAAAEFQGSGAWTESDLETFIKNTAIESFSVEKKIGPFDPLEPQPESTLDVQYLGAVGVGATNWYSTENNWMYDWTQSVLASDSNPDIFSISYGWAEDQQCIIVPFSQPCSSGGSQEYVTTVNTAFQKIGATGVTLVAASGDSGAFGRADSGCVSGHTNPAWPASSPYVTAVGATQLVSAKGGGDEPFCKSPPNNLTCAETGEGEAVCSTATGALITSGGGFSNYAARPSYQDDVVKAYLATAGAVPTQAGAFNSSGRGYPDVAALGHSFYIELENQEGLVDGTSCACPVFAGVLSLLNGARVKAGKSKIGFFNVLAYELAKTPGTFTDITVGNNKCTEDVCDCPFGFEAVKGWDATTGLGTPVVPALIAADAALMAKQQ